MQRYNDYDDRWLDPFVRHVTSWSSSTAATCKSWDSCLAGQAAPYSFPHIVGRPSKTVWKGFSSRQGMFTLWVGWYGFNAGWLGGICV